MSTQTSQQCDWRSLPMVDQMQHLLDTGELSDVTFVVGEDGQVQRISAHKWQLCRASEVFLVMFTGGLQEKGKVRVTDITPEAFKSMLQYIYTDKIELADIEKTTHVMLAANKYLLSTLLKKCFNYIRDEIKAEDVSKMLDFANLIENDQLKQVCIQVLQEKTEEVLSATSWVSSSSMFVMTLLQQDTLNVSSELPLLTACQRWARHQIDMDDKLTLREVINPLLPHLRLKTITAEQFIKSTVEDSIFTAEERIIILECIVMPELKMPARLCKLNTPRLIPKSAGEIQGEALQAVVEASVKNVNMGRYCLIMVKKLKLPPLVFYDVNNVLVYGVRYAVMNSSQVDSLVRYANKNQYRDNFTVQLIDKQTGNCVASLNCEETFNYGQRSKELYFAKPCLMKKGTRLELRVTYHTEVNGQRSFYFAEKRIQYSNNFDSLHKLLIEEKSGVLGIEEVLFKRIH